MIVNKVHTRPKPIIHRFKGTNDRSNKATHETTTSNTHQLDYCNDLPECLLVVTKAIELYYKSHPELTKSVLEDEHVKESFQQAAANIKALEDVISESDDHLSTPEHQAQTNDISEKLEKLSSELDKLKQKLETKETEIKKLKIENEKLEGSLIQWPANFSPPENKDCFTKIKAVKEDKSRNEQSTEIKSVQVSPKKLAVMHADLYDTEWRNAYTCLCNGSCDEKTAIEKLLEIFKECYQCCQRLSREQLELISRILQVPEQIFSTEDKLKKLEYNEYIYTTSLVEDTMIKHIRNIIGEIIIQKLSQCYKQQRPESFKYDKECMLDRYTTKCIELCWLTCVHEVSLTFKIDFPKGSVMDKTMAISYRKADNCKSVDFMVWPVFLNKDGSVLARGVVQTV